MKPFNLVRALEGDPIQTIGGLPARILCADLVRESGKKLVVAIACAGTEHVSVRTLEGKLLGATEDAVGNLCMKPIKKSYWLNCYKDGSTFHYATKEGADSYANKDRIACIEVAWEE